MILCGALHAGSQMTVCVGVAGGNNFSNTFGAFRDKYNETNSDDLKNNMGGMAFYEGLDVELDYRIMGLSCGLTRSYMHAGTSSKFNNGAKRLVDATYKLTNIFIGAGIDMGERTELRIEVGMVHSVSSLYSKVKLPTGEMDYSAGGASHESTHVNLGLCGRLLLTRKLGERFSCYGAVVYDRLMADNTDIAPYLDYLDTKVTHTFQGVMLNVGIGYQLMARIS